VTSPDQLSRRGHAYTTGNKSCIADRPMCGARCAYRSVTVMDKWPNKSLTTNNDTPAITNHDAYVSRTIAPYAAIFYVVPGNKR
jgi:uncharacterized membrane protein